MPRKKKTPPVPVGKKIKKARTAKKFSLDHVANETGFSTEYIKEIEAGKSMPPVGALDPLRLPPRSLPYLSILAVERRPLRLRAPLLPSR